jgi:AraC-like DNA-binding protein
MDFCATFAYNFDMSKAIRFIFQEDVQKIFTHFTSLLNIRIAFYSPEGQEILVGQNKPICDYCKLLRHKFGFESDCLILDRKMRQRAETQRDLVAYQCHGGMHEAIMPIYVADKLIGFVMIGQFRSTGLSIPEFAAGQLQKTDIHELKKRYFETPCYELETVADAVGLFAAMVKLITSNRMIRTQINPISRLVQYMEANVQENLSIEDAAELLDRSRSSVSHLFRSITGMSFKEYQIELKLCMADEYFETIPDITVQLAAQKVGFNDPFYFSRLYKKYRKISPSTKLKKLRLQYNV